MSLAPFQGADSLITVSGGLRPLATFSQPCGLPGRVKLSQPASSIEN